MESKVKKEEPYYPDGGYGWIIVLAIILINVSLLTLLPCFGVIFGDEFLKWGVTSAQTSFLLHLHSSLYCSFGFFSSPFLKLYGMRPVAFFGASLMCLGILLTSFATSYMYLIFSTSVLIGLGQGIVMPATYLATYTYFKKRLTIAITLTVTSASLSSIALPKVCDILLTKIGRQNTILVLFAFSLLSFIGCFLLKPVAQLKKRSDEEEKCMEDIKVIVITESATKELLLPDVEKTSIVYQETTVVIRQQSICSKLFDAFDLHLLKNVPLVIIIVGLGLSFAAELNIILMMQFFLGKLSSFDRTEVATAASIQSAGDIIGRLFVPLLGHLFYVSPEVMYCTALVVATIARTGLAIWPKTYAIVIVSVSLLGLTKGVRAVFQSTILPRYVVLDKIAAANGINMLFTGFTSLVIGPLIGLIRDQIGVPQATLYSASIISMSCVILWLAQFIWNRTRTVDTGKSDDT